MTTYKTITLDGATIQTRRFVSKASKLRLTIARYVIAIGALVMFIALMQLVTTVQATKVAEFQITHPCTATLHTNCTFIPVK